MNAIPLERLNAVSSAEFVAALGDVYEHAPWVAEGAAAARPFATLAALDEAMRSTVRTAGPDTQMALVRAHPDLAGKAARAGEVTDASKAEQASAGLDRLTEAEYARFHALNTAYRDRFGMPFIVCVRRHGKDSILRQFELRLANPPEAEREAALSEIFRIAALRLDQKVAAPDRLRVHGRLSTHVLDNHSGRPAQGIELALLQLSAAGPASLVRKETTNADGRTDAPLISGQPLPIGHYELRFGAADYYRRLGVELAEPPFIDVVPIRFAIAEPEGNYHVPLLLTPWSYSTYRGS